MPRNYVIGGTETDDASRKTFSYKRHITIGIVVSVYFHQEKYIQILKTN